MKKFLLSLVLVMGFVAISHASGMSVCNVGLSTGTECAVGTGTLYGVEISSVSAAGAYVVCVDTPAITQINTSSYLGNAANPQIAYVQASSTSSTFALPPVPWGRKFSTGLACFNSGNSVVNASFLIQP